MSAGVVDLDPTGMGDPIRGPSALGNDPRRLLRLTWALAVTDFKLRFFGSVLGYLWQLMRPLMLFGVLYFVFSIALDLGDDVKFFPVAMLLGIVLFSFLNEATSGSVKALVQREGIVRKVDFPRLAVPLATVTTALLNLGLNLIVVLIFLLASGGSPRWTWLALPLLVLALALLALGLGMLLSALFVRYRDVEPIWDVVLQVLFYATPIFYTVDLLAEKGGEDVAHAVMGNPFATLVQEGRHLLIDPSHVSAAEAIGGYAWLLIPVGITAVIFAAGWRVFSRQAPRIAEDL
jgi:ABC-2 type transport system permease protein